MTFNSDLKKLFIPAREIKLTRVEKCRLELEFNLRIAWHKVQDYFSLPARTPRLARALAASLVLLLLVGSGVWAVEKSQPGERLYPFKLGLNRTVAKALSPFPELAAKWEEYRLADTASRKEEVIAQPDPTPTPQAVESKESLSLPAVNPETEAQPAIITDSVEKTTENGEEKVGEKHPFGLPALLKRFGL